MLSWEATITNFIVFGLNRPRLEPTIYCTRSEHANHYHLCRSEKGEQFKICFYKCIIYRGGSRGGSPPLKLEKKLIFWRKIVIFLHEMPQKFSRLPPLGAIFLSASPLTWNPGSAPVVCNLPPCRREKIPPMHIRKSR